MVQDVQPVVGRKEERARAFAELHHGGGFIEYRNFSEPDIERVMETE